MERKTIAVTMGDPLGIGPEIVVSAVADPEVNRVCRPLAVGNRSIFDLAAARLGIDSFEKRFGVNIVDVTLPAGAPDIADLDNYFGTVQAFAGRLAYDCIARAHQLCAEGRAQATATAPINKEALRAAQVPFIGHTEIFAALTGTDDPLTMFETDGLRVFFLTRHVALRRACELVTAERLLDYIDRSIAALRRMGVTVDADAPLAVAGLNPHSGEHGLFGDEEVKEIAPAVAAAQYAGYPVVGPVSADSVFHLAHKGRFAAVLSLYHDQGHIATKTLDFERTISLTHGLPYLRTSVDHGTAFDIAWQNKASAVSMIEAILLAAKYAF